MAKVFYIFQSGFLKRKDNTLLFQNREFKKFIPIEDIEELFLMGEITLNTKVLNFLSQNGVVVHVFNHYGWYSGSFYPREEKVSGYLLVKQVEKFLNSEERLFLAKKFVEGSIKNSSTILKMESEEHLKCLEGAESIAEIMSIEANFRKEAYKRLEEFTGWEFGERSRRPPKNRLNALISFGNSLVYAKVLGEIYHTPLNPTISYLHESVQRRYSLSLDVAEIFKPIFVERLILNLIGNGTLNENHFEDALGGIFLNEEGRKLFVSAFDRQLETTFYHKRLKRKVSYKTLIRLELYKLMKHLLDEDIYKPYSVQ